MRMYWFAVHSNIKPLIEKGFAGMGWSYTGDLSDLVDKDWDLVKEEIKSRIWHAYKDDKPFGGATFEEFSKKAENKFKGNLKSFEYLLKSDKRIKRGDIIVLRSGKSIYAVGIATSEYMYNCDLINEDAPHGVKVLWLIYNDDFSPIESYSMQEQAPIRFVQKDKQKFLNLLMEFFKVSSDKELEQKIQEVLNAQKFRGDS